jgi:Cu(I)/Ag(I) efflux system periplasmic protein CusF
MKRIALALLAASLTLSSAFADETHHQQGPLSEGEIRKVDVNAKKLTIKHGPLLNLDMPAMTMVYQVNDPAMLKQVKPGDKVKFEAQRLGDVFTVTKIEAAK